MPSIAVDAVAEESDEEEEKTTVQKRKADTDCRNDYFIESLKARGSQTTRNFMNTNKQSVTDMNTGRPLKARIEVPDGVEIYPYGNQKLNIWEFQKEQLRKHIANDPSNFYTYSKEHLSLAFPLINERDEAMKDKLQNEANWKTKSGFD